jgi:hypothetical protein
MKGEENYTEYDHPQARNYLTQQHKNAKNSTMTKKLHTNFLAKTYT